jgi:hypothetical protein
VCELGGRGPGLDETLTSSSLRVAISVVVVVAAVVILAARLILPIRLSVDVLLREVKIDRVVVVVRVWMTLERNVPSLAVKDASVVCVLWVMVVCVCVGDR